MKRDVDAIVMMILFVSFVKDGLVFFVISDRSQLDSTDEGAVSCDEEESYVIWGRRSPYSPISDERCTNRTKIAIQIASVTPETSSAISAAHHSEHDSNERPESLPATLRRGKGNERILHARTLLKSRPDPRFLSFGSEGPHGETRIRDAEASGMRAGTRAHARVLRHWLAHVKHDSRLLCVPK